MLKIHHARFGISWVTYGWHERKVPNVKTKLNSHRLFSFLYQTLTFVTTLTSECVVEILKCHHSRESYWPVLSCGAVYYVVQGGSNFWVCGWIRKCDHSNESYWVVLCCEVNLTLRYDHSIKTFWAALTYGEVSFLIWLKYLPYYCTIR